MKVKEPQDSSDVLRELFENFNRFHDSVRTVQISKSGCSVCAETTNTIRKSIERFGSSKLHCFFVSDNALPVEGLETCTYFSDPEDRIAKVFSDYLKVKEKIAHYVLLFSPRILWEIEESPPVPSFWQHHSTQANPNSLNPNRLFDETKFLLEVEEPDLEDIAETLIEKKKTRKP